jgi:hypothetical protein
MKQESAGAWRRAAARAQPSYITACCQDQARSKRSKFITLF